MKTFAISISKPCHEDWNKMTPDAKGAFCGSCQKSVHDFTNKTQEQIISVFEEKGKENVCGRFTNSQLSQPLVEFGEVNSTSRLAKFLYALLLAFGSALFINTDAFGQTKMGKMAIRTAVIESVIEEAPAVQDTVVEVKHNTPITCGLVNVPNTEEVTFGQAILVRNPRPAIDTLIAKNEIIRMGDTIIDMEEIYPDDKILDDVIDTLIYEPIDTVVPIIDNPRLLVMGEMSYTEIIKPVPQETLFPTEEKTEDKPVVIKESIIAPQTEENSDVKSDLTVEPAIFSPVDFEVKVSPNPSRGEITLTYTLDAAVPVRIDLFDITGKMVKTLSQQGKQYAGKYNVSYSISDLPNGIYMATLMTNDKKSSAKIILTK